MTHDALAAAFNDIFPNIVVVSYKKIDPHSIEIVTPNYHAIWTYYGPRSFKLETK